MAAHSSILAWRIPWAEEPGELQSMGSQTIRYNQATTHTHTKLMGTGQHTILSGIWKKLIPTLKDDFEGFNTLIRKVTAHVVEKQA